MVRGIKVSPNHYFIISCPTYNQAREWMLEVKHDKKKKNQTLFKIVIVTNCS